MEKIQNNREIQGILRIDARQQKSLPFGGWGVRGLLQVLRPGEGAAATRSLPGAGRSALASSSPARPRGQDLVDWWTPYFHHRGK